jgi:hypothetical protein
MGGSSSSSSSTTNFTDAGTINANLEDATSGVVGDENITSTTVITSILDGGAISESFDFASESLNTIDNVVDSGFDFAGDSLDFAGDTVDESFEFGRSSLDFGEQVLFNSFEFGAGSLDQAFEFSSKVAEQSSLENREILNSAINASNDAQSSVLGFAKSVSTPQTEFIKAGVIGLAVLMLGGFLIRGRK